MNSDAKGKKKSFSKILESGAKIDSIFEDNPVPKGSNPFQQLSPLKIEETETQGYQTEANSDGVSIFDNDMLSCLSRKYSSAEKLIKLLGSDISFGELTSEILRICIEHIPAEAGSLLELDYESENMFFRAVTGRSSKNLLSFTIPRGQGIVGFVCENHQTMKLSNVDDSSVYLRSISDSVGFETKNLIAHPIIIRGISFGCIELLNRLGENEFTDADREILVSICEVSAKIIEHRLLLSAATKELENLQKKLANEGEEDGIKVA